MILDFLVGKGYKKNTGFAIDKLYDSTWNAYRVYKGETKECVCNDKNPQFIVYCYEYDGKHSYKIELCNENNLAWVNLNYYGLSEDDIIDNIDYYEKSLIRMWEASWK